MKYLIIASLLFLLACEEETRLPLQIQVLKEECISNRGMFGRMCKVYVGSAQSCYLARGYESVSVDCKLFDEYHKTVEAKLINHEHLQHRLMNGGLYWIESER